MFYQAIRAFRFLLFLLILPGFVETSRSETFSITPVALQGQPVPLSLLSVAEIPIAEFFWLRRNARVGDRKVGDGSVIPVQVRDGVNPRSFAFIRG